MLNKLAQALYKNSNESCDSCQAHLVPPSPQQLMVPPQGTVDLKHQAALYPTLDVGQLSCYNQQCPNVNSINVSNSCYVKSRHYYQPWTERPSYYLDLTQPFIGGRPVYQTNTVNAIPRTMRYDSANLMDRDFYCQQSCWGPACV